MGVDDPQLEVLLACFDGHKRASKVRRQVGERIKAQSGVVLDEVVVRVNHKGTVRAVDPRRVVAGTLTPALTWGVFCVLAGLGWSGTLFWAVIGAVCGGLYAFYTEHVLTRKQFKSIGTRLSHDASALLLYVHGADAKALLDDVAPEHPRVASAATIRSNLSGTVAGDAHDPDDTPPESSRSATPDRSLVSMLIFRYPGADSADKVATKQTGVQTELLVRADRNGRYHVVSPGTGVRAFMPTDVLGWGLFGVVYGGIVGLAGDGGVLGFAEGAVVTGVLWAIFGLIAGTLYGLWAGRSISARRIKTLRPLLPPDTSTALCWVEGPMNEAGIANLSALASDQLILRFTPVAGGAVLEV